MFYIKEGDKKLDYQFDLRALRRANGYSAREMAELLGVHTNTYRNWEKKPKTITVSYAFKIANILNVSIEDIFLRECSTKC